MKSTLLSTLLLLTLMVNYLSAQPPTLTSFSPATGNVGSTVTLTGTGFNTTAASNVVYFGATKATVTGTPTATSLTVTVPSGATYDMIRVLNTGTSLSCMSNQRFVPTFSPNKTSIVGTDYASVQNIAIGSGTMPITSAAGDLNNDGKADMVVCNYNVAYLSVYPNTGSIGTVSFGTPVTLTTNGSSTGMRGLAIADVDMDGKPDIVAVGSGTDKVSIYRNTTTGSTISMAAKVDLTLPTAGSQSVVVGDIDNDGKPEIVAVNGNVASVFVNASTSGSISFPTRADFGTANNPFGLAIGDLDGDGKLDLITGNYDQATTNVSILRNTTTVAGTITFATHFELGNGAPYSSMLEAGDLDGDGKIDIVVGNQNSATVSAFRNTTTTVGTITFGTHQDFGAEAAINRFAIADLNGDGKPDLAISAGSSSNLSLLKNSSTSGTINFDPKASINTGVGSFCAAVADLDGDGKPDIMYPDFGTNVLVYRYAPTFSADANLSALSTTAGTLTPSFAANTTSYTAAVAMATGSVTVTPTVNQANATVQVRVNGGSYATVASATASSALALNYGPNSIEVKVTAQDLTTNKIYTITVTRAYPPNMIVGGTTYPVNGTANAPTSFATIQAVSDHLAANGTGGTGNIIFELQSGYNPAMEPATGIYFDTIMFADASRRVVIRPAAAFTTTVSGTVAGAGMINFRGTRYLTLEGRQGGTGAIGLTVTNLSTATTDSTSAIKFSVGASNITLSNCNVKGAAKGATNTGVVLIGKGSATSGNNNVVLDGCNIDGTGAAHNGICFNGNITSTTLENAGDTIRNCNIYDFYDNSGSSGTAGIRVQQGSADVTISGNSIYQTVSRNYTAQFLCYGILVGSGTYYTSDNVSITNNYIGGNGPLATGTMVHTAGSVVAGYAGIYTTYGTNATVTGNIIKNISITGSSSAGTFNNAGIFSSLFYSGAITMSNNTIDSFQVNNNTGPVTISGIHIISQLDTTFVKNIAPSYLIQNNTLRNITANPATTYAGVIYGVRMAPTSTTGQGGLLYYNNMVVSINQNTLTNLKSTGSTTGSYAIGIWSNATNAGTSTHFIRLIPTITNNTIQNITSNATITSVGYPAAGGVVILNAHTGNATYTDTLKIRNNTIRDLYANNTGDINTSAGGIFVNQGRSDISQNKIFNIYNNANGSTNSPYVYGINVFIQSAQSAIYNNYISLGDTATGNQLAFGIMNPTLSTSGIGIYNNTVLISGNGGSKNSAGVMRGDNTYAGNATQLTVKNNLLINRRTGAGTNSAIAMPGTNAVTSNNNTLITFDAARATYYGTGALDLATWKSTTASDAYSYYAQSSGSSNLSVEPTTVSLSDLFTNGTYSSLAHLQVSTTNAANWLVAGKGDATVGVSKDYAGNTRGTTAGIPTCIGADEFVSSATPPVNVISGNVAAGDSTIVKFAGRELMKVYWLAGGTLPGSFTSRYYSGKAYAGASANANKGASYYTLSAATGSSYSYKVKLNYGAHETGSISNSDATTRLAQYNGSWMLTKAGQASTAGNPQTVVTDTLTQQLGASNTFMLTDNVAPLVDTLAISGNTISGTQSSCSGSTPASFTGSTPTGGTGTYTYKWLSSTTGATTGFAAASGTNTNISYLPAALTQSTWFRRVVYSGFTDTSAAVKVTVTNAIASNSITSSPQTICSGATPTALTGSTPTGGDGTTYTYSWLRSTTSATSGFAVASGTTNAQGYTPAALTQNTWYRRVVASGACANDTTAAVKVTVNVAITGNSITSSPQTICSGSTPTALTGSTPTGGDGSTYTYSWLSSTTSATAGFAVASGTATNQGYTPSALTTSTWYRRVVTSGACANDTAAAVKITVTNAIATNSITSSPQTICSGSTPTALTGSTPTGGDGTTYTYSWLSSTTSATAGFAVASGTTTNQGYTPSALTTSTWYRRVVASGVCANDTAAAVKITVTNAIATNSITSSPQTICSGSTPTALTGSTPTGGDGSTYTYSWLSSTTSATSGFAVASGTTTAQGYTPAALTQSTWYKRVVTSGACAKDTTAAVKITITNAVATNSITSSPQTICTGSTPTALTGSTPTGGDGSTYTYSWLSSTTSATAGFAVASGTTTGQGYTPTALTQNTWYKRVVTSGVCANDTTAALAITVNAAGTWVGSVSSAWENTANWSCPALPTASTNVTINSGAPNMPVIIDAQQANNITIGTGASLTLNAAASQLWVYGTVTNNGTWSQTNGKMILAGSSAQTLPAGTYNKVEVSNTAGAIAGGAITLNDSLIMTNGTLTLGANNLTLGNASYASAGSATSYIVTNGAGTVTANNVGMPTGKIAVTIPIGNSTYNPVTLNNTSTVDNFSFKVIDSVTNNYSGSTPTGARLSNNVVNRTWIINEAVAGGSLSTVTLQWAATDELSGFNRAASYVARYNGSNWSANTAAAATGSNPYKQSRTNVTAFSPFSVASSGTLPVELVSFTGTREANTAKLKWITASELNNDHFTLERSTDNRHFEAIAQVKGHGTTALINNYDYRDELSNLVKQGVKTVYYRLIQVDADGTSTESGNISISLEQKNLEGMTITAQPNPFVSDLSLSIESSKTETISIRVIDIAGRTVAEHTASVKQGSNTISLDQLSTLNDGVYFINVSTSQGFTTHKVVKEH